MSCQTGNCTCSCTKCGSGWHCGTHSKGCHMFCPPHRSRARRVLAGAGLVLAAAVAGVLSAVAGMFWAGGAW